MDTTYKEISHRMAIVILIDQSGSMAEMHSLTNMLKSKAELVATGVNTFLSEILHRSRGADDLIHDIFDIALLGYGGEKASYLLHNGLFTPSQLDRTRSEYRIDRPYHNFPIGKQPLSIVEYRQWLSPTAHGRTPMGDALRKCIRLLRSWCRRHPADYAPLVINISDGEASDITAEELVTLAERLKEIGTTRGTTLFMNTHIDNLASTPSVKFPSGDEPLPPLRHTRLLHQLSSDMPNQCNDALVEMKGAGHTPPFKALCYNCGGEEIVGLLHINSPSPTAFL